MKVGDLVEDKHYGLGIVEEMGREDGAVPSVHWVRVFFPEMKNFAFGGHIRLFAEHARALKVISKK